MSHTSTILSLKCFVSIPIIVHFVILIAISSGFSSQQYHRMSGAVFLGRATVQFHFDFWPHPATAGPPFLLKKETEMPVRVMSMKGPFGLFHIIRISSNDDVKPIKWWRFGFRATSSSNSDFFWRSIVCL
jgi:hypothetical protein